MKRLFFSVVLLSFVLMLAACGGNNSSSDGSSSSSDGGSEGKSGEQIQLKIAGYQPEDHPSTQALYKFAEDVEKNTDGRITAKVYPASQLGDYITVYKEVMEGTIEMALITTPSETDPRLDLLLAPYMATSYEKVEQIFSPGSYVLEKMQEVNNEQGVYMLGVHANGFGGIGTTKEIKNLTDSDADKDLLLRTALGPIYSEPMKDLGFRIMTIPFADLSNALQTGTVDGWSGGEASLNYFGFRDIIKYFYTTNDFFNADAFYINKELWDSLSDEDQAVIQAAAVELTKTSIETAQGYDEEYLKKLEEEGIEVIRLSEEEVEQLASIVREKTYPKLKEAMGEEFIDGLLEYLESLD